MVKEASCSVVEDHGLEAGLLALRECVVQRRQEGYAGAKCPRIWG